MLFSNIESRIVSTNSPAYKAKTKKNFLFSLGSPQNLNPINGWRKVAKKLKGGIYVYKVSEAADNDLEIKGNLDWDRLKKLSPGR